MAESSIPLCALFINPSAKEGKSKPFDGLNSSHDLNALYDAFCSMENVLIAILNQPRFTAEDNNYTEAGEYLALIQEQLSEQIYFAYERVKKVECKTADDRQKRGEVMISYEIRCGYSIAEIAATAAALAVGIIN